MIQFNLLPDVKLEFVKAQRTKRTVITAAFVSAGSSFVIFILLFLIVHGVQAVTLHSLDSDIKKYDATINQTPDLAKVLTIQSQLGALPSLHQQKPAATRIFTFLQQLTPVDVTISNCSFDYTANTVSITGATTGLDRVNTFVDTLKFTTYSTGQDNGQRAFTDVVLSQFSKTSTDTTYTITATFDPALFDNASDIKLSIPDQVSTRSIVEQPTDLFKKQTVPTGQK